uniref:Saposin B-type domain-containing protein n=1 Tax=Plectus sambesii TaxID=2011161 RepID=A0A914V732_9BILA
MVTPTLSMPKPKEKLVCGLCLWAVDAIIDILNDDAGISAGEITAIVCAADDWNLTAVICNTVVYIVAEYVIKEVEGQVLHHFHLDPEEVCEDLDFC